MKLPFKVSTTTSNFMIGGDGGGGRGSLSAARVYRSGLAMPVMLGVLAVR